MNIKSLLLGSAAALAAVSGAQAADAIVAAEPEPMEYVRVCDAFGTGYFYIPGTETCLKIGGYVRFEANIGQDQNSFNDTDWDTWSRVQLDFTAKSDTELGTLTSVASVRFEANQDIGYTSNITNGGGSGINDAYINEAYIQLGGFKVGRYYNPWDKGINGESDWNSGSGTTRMQSVGYFYTGSAFTAGVQVDELSRLQGVGGQNVGIEALVTTKFGGVAFDLLGAYDLGAEEGAVRALISAPVGPGTFQALAIWSSGLGDANGENAYANRGEWTLAASYAFKVADKLTITPGGSYIWNAADGVGDYGSDEAYRVGLTVDYTIVPGFTAKVTANYNKVQTAADEFWDGFVRLDRTF
ncbi:porin [Neorhizobium galegae]|uniref:porin n=1 Tax=Neorhizobium galegae TaxID=399 RepID=UPI0006211CFF|nr:porin [Neorhizobium galegae]CDZ29338.1 Porin subfamily [Neorhizobium galegae bv. officinalis]KAB1108166.1 porin [Neorhizobium galegae]MCQ1764701.1 porin [Neorhizobium galegae]MCQ1772066.1 porin [Neorhizobium galegae]MCQ1777754.1 porin [Neorhizobium galegae]